MYQASCLQSVADISGDLLLHLIWRSRCSITFSSSIPASLSPAQLICLLPWGMVCPSSGVFGSEMICLERLILAPRPTLATRLVKWLIMLWQVKEPRPAVLTHVGGNILHIVSAEMRKVGVEERQRGVKLGAMRVEVGAQSTHFMWLDKRETQKHMKKRNKNALLSRCNYLHVPLVNEKPVGIGHRMFEFLKCCFWGNANSEKPTPLACRVGGILEWMNWTTSMWRLNLVWNPISFMQD